MSANPYLLLRERNAVELLCLTYPYMAAPPPASKIVAGYTVETCGRTLGFQGNLPRADNRECIWGLPIPSISKSHCGNPSEVEGHINFASLIACADSYAHAHEEDIREALQAVERIMNGETPSLLAAGRQTYNIATDRNSPAPVALANFLSIRPQNLPREQHVIPSNFKGMLYQTMKYLADPGGVIVPNVKSQRISTQKRTAQGETIKRVKLSEQEVHLTQQEFLVRAHSLNTMVKGKERGKINKRAIATAGMPMRAMNLLIEAFARVLCEKSEESGLPVGGNRKKAKLRSMVNKAWLDSEGLKSACLSGDNTKWNETQQPQAFATIMLTLLADVNCTMHTKKVMCLGFAMFMNKLAKLGPGIICRSKSENKWLQESCWDAHTRRACNAKLTKGLDKCLGNRVGDSIWLPCGMLMGMYNMFSTINGILPFYDPMLPDKRYEYRYLGMQSSDDYTVTAQGTDVRQCLLAFKHHILVCKALAQNVSPKKTWACMSDPDAFFEFTSMYFIDGTFMPNTSMSIGSIRPAGKDESQDLDGMHQAIARSMTDDDLPVGTASTAMRLAVAMYRSMYRIPSVMSTEWRTDRSVVCAQLTSNWTQEEMRALLVSDGGDETRNLSTMRVPELACKIEGMNPSYRLKLLSTVNPFNQFRDDPDPNSEREMSQFEMPTSSHAIKLPRNRSILQTDKVEILKTEKRIRLCAAAFAAAYPSSDYVRSRGAWTISQAIRERAAQLVEQVRRNNPEKVQDALAAQNEILNLT
uniref:RNA-directed RNA polymerase catalytic subunit n=1 Tax=Wenling hagfish influenza virus TaxID=2116481 RepID=A0A2P1GNQ3_9ORTO|nr:PB1 [Wenling hagfish influenza virus]